MPLAPVEECYVSGGKYRGQLLKLNNGTSVRHGRGTFTADNGTTYEGEYLQDRRHGKGKQTFADGAWYSGDYIGDLQHGQGEYHWAVGDFYVGAFYNDTQEGQGKLTWSSGDVYEGGWKGGCKHGYGVMTWESGDRCEGNFEHNLNQGHGVYIWPDGHSYTGNFKDDLCDGEAEVKLPTGEVFQGRFEQHMCVAKLVDGEDVLAPQLLQAIENEQCTARVAGRFAVHQEFYVCRTCWPDVDMTMSGLQGCCVSCAKSCHEGHELEKKPAGKFRCWCGSGLGPGSCAKNPFAS
eukprot:TRINITY_DN3317_c0_g1_i2.p1 TRINITY_DN3317_c0_g1~~TRINITY_DN3317_c0_g1_i2.p1  ORF type:complete len:292 (+),score=60.58 TRINITY_DN3317_c0_g1_i2:73-948(+)